MIALGLANALSLKSPTNVTETDNGSGFVRIAWTNQETIAGTEVWWTTGTIDQGFQLGVANPGEMSMDDLTQTYPSSKSYYARHRVVADGRISQWAGGV